MLAVVGGHSFQDYRAYRDRVLASLPGLGLRLDDDVVLLGTVPDAELPAWYAAADVLAFPSTKEGWGLAVLEAMSAGLPVVASDLPVFREYLHPGPGRPAGTGGRRARPGPALAAVLDDRTSRPASARPRWRRASASPGPGPPPSTRPSTPLSAGLHPVTLGPRLRSTCVEGSGGIRGAPGSSAAGRGMECGREGSRPVWAAHLHPHGAREVTQMSGPDGDPAVGDVPARMVAPLGRRGHRGWTGRRETAGPGAFLERPEEQRQDHQNAGQDTSHSRQPTARAASAVPRPPAYWAIQPVNEASEHVSSGPGSLRWPLQVARALLASGGSAGIAVASCRSESDDATTEEPASMCASSRVNGGWAGW